MKFITFSFKAFCSLTLFSTLSLSSVAKDYVVEEISPTPFAGVIQRTGKLDFKRTTSLSFKSTGYLTKLTVDEGDTFKTGQLLASLATDELLAAKNASYAQLLQAKRDVNRISKLLKNKSSSERDLDVAKTLVEANRAAYRVSAYNLEKSQIIATFDGVVLDRYTELGELQAPGKLLLKVAATDNNWVVKVALTGTEIGQVKLQQTVKVRLQRLGDVEGVISRIPATANTNNNLFMIDVLIPGLSIDSGVIAGQIAEVIIDFYQEDFVYAAPLKGLMAVDDNGRALLLTKTLKKGVAVNEFTQQAFEIFNIDSDYVYLYATENDELINVVTQGWQQLAIGKMSDTFVHQPVMNK